MSVFLSPIFQETQFKSDGTLAVGYKIYTYAEGSSTPLTTYTTSTGATPQANPIVLNARGEPANQIWLTGGLGYKLVLTTDADVVIRTEDNIRGVGDNTISVDQWQTSGLTPTYVSATSFTLAGDQTTAFQVNRRIKSAVTAGTAYSTIVSSVFTTLTTVTVVNDSGSALDSGLSAVSYGILTSDNPSVPVLKDSDFRVSASADKTKKLAFEIDGLTTATTRTVTVQDKNGTMALTSDDGITPRALNNVGLAISMASNAATIALKGSDGNDPSATNSVDVGFRSSTITSGNNSKITVVAAISTVISSGSTGGTTSGVLSRIWVAAINNSGTLELAWYAGSSSDSPNINENNLISTTAEGGAGTADTINTWYSTTARSNVPFTILGYWESTQATAGTWVTSPSSISINPLRGVASTLTSGTAIATTSGTSHDFTGIPSTVKLINITFSGNSTNGTSIPMIQIGDSGGIENTGYLGAATQSSAGGNSLSSGTTGFLLSGSHAAAAVVHGVMVLILQDAATNTWVASMAGSTSDAARILAGGGSKSLSATLDRIRFTTVNGTDAFDAGLINIIY